MDRGMQDHSISEVENNPDATKQTIRRRPCCGFCRNHKLKVPVINHHCPYTTCTCAFCELTRRRRKIMCHQQRVWRFKKGAGGWVEEENEARLPQGQTEDQLLMFDTGKYPARRKMVCDKCRNHDIIVKKRGHKGSCPYEECTCNLCNFTIKRQQLMKHQQRVRRSQVAVPAEQTNRAVTQPPTDADSPMSDVQALEETSPTGSPWDKCDKRKEDGREVTTSPHNVHPKPCQDAQLSEEQTNALKECPVGNNSSLQSQEDSGFPIILQPPPPPPLPPPLCPLQEYHKTSEIFPICSKSDHSLNSSANAECTDSISLSVRYKSLRPPSQMPAVPAPLPALPKHRPDTNRPQYLQGVERMCGAELCTMSANNIYAPPQAPLRPQARLPCSQREWQFLSFPYRPAIIQSIHPPAAQSVCDNFRMHHPAIDLNESWQTARVASHHTETGGIHHPYSTGLPYIAATFLHPSATPSMSFIPGSRALPEYGPPLPVFRQRVQEQQDVHLGTFIRGSSGNVN